MIRSPVPLAGRSSADFPEYSSSWYVYEASIRGLVALLRIRGTKNGPWIPPDIWGWRLSKLDSRNYPSAYCISGSRMVKLGSGDKELRYGSPNDLRPVYIPFQGANRTPEFIRRGFVTGLPRWRCPELERKGFGSLSRIWGLGWDVCDSI